MFLAIRGKIRWAKLSRFQQFQAYHESVSVQALLVKAMLKYISAKTLMGLKPQMFSPENLSTFTVYKSK